MGRNGGLDNYSQAVKILFLSPAYPYRGGIADFTHRLAHQFQDEGHEVEIVTFTLQYPGFLFPGKTQYSESAAPENLHIERRLNSVNPFNWLNVGNELKQRRADLLLVTYWMFFMAPSFGTVARRVRSNGKTKVIAIAHNLLPHERHVWDEPCARFFLNSVDGVVSLSQSVLEESRRIAPKLPAVFSPHPLYDHFGLPVDRDAACQHLGLDSDKRYFLFFGLIRDYKGLDWLLDAWSDARLRDKDIRLIIAGEFYGDGGKYHAQAERLGLENRIEWRTSFISDEEVRYYFSAADLIVQPYKSATQSGVTQIAYHFERPMLVTRVGGLPEIVPDRICGYVTEPTPLSIADAMVEFAEKQPDFSNGLRDEKQKYSWDKMSEAIKSLL